MRIYLDSCCFQRPFDDQTQRRIRIETEALLVVLSAVEASEQTLLGSDALDFELKRIPDEARRVQSLAMVALAAERIEINLDVEALAMALEQQGVQAMDAIHLALASEFHADYFCTCDDKLFRKALTLSGLSCKITTILGLVSEVTK